MPGCGQAEVCTLPVVGQAVVGELGLPQRVVHLHCHRHLLLQHRVFIVLSCHLNCHWHLLLQHRQFIVLSCHLHCHWHLLLQHRQLIVLSCHLHRHRHLQTVIVLGCHLVEHNNPSWLSGMNELFLFQYLLYSCTEESNFIGTKTLKKKFFGPFSALFD